MTATCSAATPTSPVRITQGESKQFLLVVHDVLTKAFTDLTDAEGYFTIKERWEDIAPLVLKRTPGAGGASGEFTIFASQNILANTGHAYIYLVPSDTTILSPEITYWLDVWIILAPGQHRRVVERRECVIDPRITRIP